MCEQILYEMEYSNEHLAVASWGRVDKAQIVVVASITKYPVLY